MNWRLINFPCSILVLVFVLASQSLLAGTIPDEIVKDLKSEEFKVREIAEKKLLAWSREDSQSRIPLVFEQAVDADDPEVRQRCHNVLYALAMDEYLKDGEGFVGIQMIAIRANIPGKGEEHREVIAISRVLRDTPAQEAGLRVGDMIASVNDEELAGDDALPSFQNMIRALKPGSPTRFGVIRDGELIEVNLTLGRRPPDERARIFGQQMLDMNELAKQDQDRFFKEWIENLKD